MSVPGYILDSVDSPDRGDIEPLKDGRGRFARSPEAAHRRDRAVQLRAAGKTYREIAELVGYRHAAAAQKAVTKALREIPQESCDQLIRQEEQRLAEIDSKLSAIISSPPVRTTSIGRTQWDVRTCCCPTRARTDRDHDPDCTVQPVLDMTAVIQAAKARVQVGESLRRMRGADRPPPGPAWTEDELRQWAEIRAAQALRAQQAPVPALAPLPANYATMTPLEQMAADVARRRAQHAEHQAASVVRLPGAP